MSRPCHVLRVFTRDGEGGNHLGVVNDSVGVDEDWMQQVAIELGYSETVFVDWSDTADHPSVRIFTPGGELPFAGHPLVGTAWVFEKLGPGGTGSIVTTAGTVAYRVEGDVVEVEASIPIAEVDGDTEARVTASAGLPESIASRTLALPKHYHLAEYPSRTDIDALAPDMHVLAEHRFGLYAFARDGDLVTARFFVPSHGIPEDPATGSAAMALAQEFRLRGETAGSVTIHQGDQMGWPSAIRLDWTDSNTTIGGSVVRDDVVLV